MPETLTITKPAEEGVRDFLAYLLKSQKVRGIFCLTAMDEKGHLSTSLITDPEELKRFLHVGMGPCQGRTCGRLVLRILARKLKKPVSEIPATKQRPPMVPIPIRSVLGEDE